ncbi:acyltransferase family protein [Microbacterium sp. ASV49]|uniref:Acyltransferase n=1 Tax=Microbacterium candidum TaxID=3041922 RepID=A0ABT7MZK7_9MICO|nr:acyltransferase [Microbacterium sp. ASV49]MDL9979887.1 acyltransferase [Microbacterium sp. ASV49]
MTAVSIVTSPPATAGRDRAVDLVRALCIIGVVTLHALMVGVTVSAAGPSFVNASDGSWWIVPLSWVFQVMPLFFVIGGFSGATALRRMRARGEDAAAFVGGRIRRLLLPAAVTIGTAGALLAVLSSAGVPASLVELAGWRYAQPLWFLGVFLLCQALLPVMLKNHDRAPLRTLAVLVAAAVAVDVVRAVTGIDAIGFVDLLFVWLALQQIGFFLADGSIDRIPVRARVVIAIVAVALLAAAFGARVYSPDLIANINPPTTALVLVGVAHTAVFSLVRGRIARFAERPLPAAVTRFVSARAMTIYLWHMPVLLALAGISALVAMATGIALPAPGGAEWWLSRPIWLAAALGGTALVAIRLTRFESMPVPPLSGSAGRLAVSVLVGVTAVALLLVVGTSPGTAVVSVALLLASLRMSTRPAPAPGFVVHA